jgi:hypothetical protein
MVDRIKVLTPLTWWLLAGLILILVTVAFGTLNGWSDAFIAVMGIVLAAYIAVPVTVLALIDRDRLRRGKTVTPEPGLARVAAPRVSAIIRPSEASSPQYICYLAYERLETLWQQLDEDALAEPEDDRLSGMSLGYPKAGATPARHAASAVSHLAVVLRYLDSSEGTKDLNELVSEGGRLDRRTEWYRVTSDFSIPEWDPKSPGVTLNGLLPGFTIELSCRKENFPGLAREGDSYIPTSTSRFLFDGDLALPMQGLIRIVSVGRGLIKATPLYLVLNPLASDLGDLADVAL